VKLKQAEVTQTLAFLDAIYGNLMPKGDPQTVRDAWIFALERLNVESGELLASARQWVAEGASEYPPRPGQLGEIITKERARRQRRAVWEEWERSGGLIGIGGVLVNRDGETVDSDGKVIHEIGEGRPKDPDLDQTVRRITERINQGG
jgi:hypothetical protein